MGGDHHGCVVGASANDLQILRLTLACHRQACCHHSHANFVAQSIVIGRTVYHVCIVGSISTNGVHGFTRLRQFQSTLGRGDQNKHALGATHVHAFKEWAGHRLLGGNARTVWTAGHRCAHHCFALLAHDGANVLKVDVHQGLDIDDFGNPAHRVAQHIVGKCKGCVLRHIVAKDLEQFLIEHNDQRVHVFFELIQARFSVVHASPAFPLKGLGHHPDGQNSHLTRDSGHHGRCTRAGAPAKTGCDEEHVTALQGGSNALDRRLGGLTTALGPAARTQSRAAELNDLVGRTQL